MSKGLFYLLLLPVTLGLCGWQGWRWWSWASSPVVSASAATSSTVADPTIQIEIPSGTSAQQIGGDLEAAGIIQSADAWNLWTRWQTLRDRQGGFQAGIYDLNPTQSLTAIADVIWQGNVLQQSFTIPEGGGMQQIADYFEEQGFFTAEAFLEAAQQIPRDRYSWLPDGISNLEGFLYPDTYQLAEAPTPQSIIDQMLTRFQQTALPIYQQNQTNIPYSLLEWVTLASIVEREAVVSEERPLIASVFAKRLREGIPLGADPTVEYAFGIRQTPDQPLTYDQVNTPSPYNTYINAGLPPGPIASPGLASLEASVNPADTLYLYFVARYDGTHVFSQTLAEHEAAQAQIRDDLESQRESNTGSSPVQ